MNFILSYFTNQGKLLSRVWSIAIILRLVAALFSQGYEMIDDHYLAIEPASSWVHGENYNNWYPNTYNGVESAQPFSYVYYFLNYDVLWLETKIGITDPQLQVLGIRLIQALWSILGLYFFIQWAKLKFVDRQGQWTNVGMYVLWFVALGGLLSAYAVHQMVEMVVIPFLLYALYHYERGNLFRAAFAIGLAVGMRYQLVWIPLVIGILFVLKTQWKQASWWLVAFAIAFSLTQIDNLVVWHKPIYQHLLDYASYNAQHAGEYPNNPFTYFSFIGYFIIPPFSLLALYYWTRSVKTWWMKEDFWSFGVLAFILFHVVFPNRQERFLLPAVPLFIGLAGMYLSQATVMWEGRRLIWLNRGLGFSLVVTLILSVGFVFNYGKEGMVESCYYLYKQSDYTNVWVDNADGDGPIYLPLHYTGKFTHQFSSHGKSNLVGMVDQLATFPKFAPERLPYVRPNYLWVISTHGFEAREEAFRTSGLKITKKAEFEMGWIEHLLSTLRKKPEPRIAIYHIED